MTLTSKSRSFRLALFAIVGAPVGYLVGRAIGRLEREGLWTAPDLSWSDTLALALGLMMLLVGLVTVVISASRKTLGRQIDPERGRAASPAQAFFYAQQGVVMALAGVMLGAPVVLRAAFDPMPPLLASAAMIGIVALFLTQTASNLQLWIRGDELMRRAITDTATLSFLLLQGALFLWAAGEKLGLLPSLTLWDAVSVMMAVYLAIATIVTWRRGLAG